MGAVAGCTSYEPKLPGASFPSDSSVLTHSVARGETLWSISQRYHVSVDALARANGISDRSQIEVGQRLRIPGRGSSAPEPAAVSRPVPPSAVSSGPVLQDSGRFVWPVQGRVIAIFGARRRGTINKGIDIQARPGSEVLASRGGRVSFVHESLPGFGKTIILEHSGGFASVYAYVGEILVRQGESVVQRQRIARVGETGRAEVPALHFQIRRQQKPINPLHYLP